MTVAYLLNINELFYYQNKSKIVLCVPLAPLHPKMHLTISSIDQFRTTDLIYLVTVEMQKYDQFILLPFKELYFAR